VRLGNKSYGLGTLGTLEGIKTCENGCELSVKLLIRFNKIRDYMCIIYRGVCTTPIFVIRVYGWIIACFWFCFWDLGITGNRYDVPKFWGIVPYLLCNQPCFFVCLITQCSLIPNILTWTIPKIIHIKPCICRFYKDIAIHNII